jgi:hypothetical protein
VISSRHYDRRFCRHGMVDSGTGNDSGLWSFSPQSYSFGRKGSCILGRPLRLDVIHVIQAIGPLFLAFGLWPLGHVLAAVIRDISHPSPL